MTTYTRAQLVTEAAHNLKLIGDDNTLEDDYEDYIDGKVDALLAQLSADEVVDIDDTSAIPAEYYHALGKLLANNSAERFGVQYSEDVKLVFERHLRRTASASATLEVLKAEYF